MKAGINRLLAILLSCAMLLGMLPAFAEEVPAPSKAPAEEAGAETEAPNAPTETEDLPLMQTRETIPFAKALGDGLMMDEADELYNGGNYGWFFPDDGRDDDVVLCKELFVDKNGDIEMYFYGGKPENYDKEYLNVWFSPYNVSDTRVKWTSSDPSVVRIDTEITNAWSDFASFTAVGIGTATITGSTMDGSGVTVSRTVTVKPRLADEIRLSRDAIDLRYDGTGYLDESTLYCNFTPWKTTDQRLAWTNSNPDVVRMEVEEYVNSYGYKTSRVLVKGLAPGEATITATAMDGSGASDSVKVVVYPEPKIHSISFSKNPVLLGETVTVNVCTSAEGVSKLTYGFYYPEGELDRKYLGETTQKTVRDGKAYWSFQVTPDAMRCYVEIEIRFTSPSGWSTYDIHDSAEIMVADKNLKPTGITVYGPDSQGVGSLSVGDTFQMPFYLQPSGSYATIKWNSSNTNVAAVDSNGLVTATGEGTATITATTDNNKKANAIVRVVDPYKPTAVKLDKTGTVNLNLGETLTLTPSLSPETAQATYSWKTSSTKIATVADGAVTPVGEGTATITVTATRGKIKKTATVKVKVVDPYKPTGVKLDKTGTVSLNLGDSLTLTPSLTPETAQATYSWKTSSTKIATVADGVVTPVGEGTATITVTATRGNIKKTATVKVKVVDPYKPTAVKLDKTGTVNLNLGVTLTLTPSLSPETAQATYTWKTSSTKIATVVDGVVAPVGEGTATITVTATRGNIKKTATVKVKVVDPYKPTAVKLDKTGTVNLNLGETLTLSPSLSPETAQATYSWKTSSTKIATVEGGVVTPVGEGTATITVTATRGKIKKTATVKVKVVDPYKPTSLKLRETGTVWLELGDSTQLTPILGPETAKATYSWKSSSTKIATVDENGVVRPVAKGTATITVTATRGKIKKTASVKVKVVEPYVVDALSFGHVDSPGDLKILVGELSYITVGVKPASASKTANLSFSLSNGNVYLSHKATGEIRVLGVQPGTTTITVKDVNTGVKATMKVVVRNRKA